MAKYWTCLLLVGCLVPGVVFGGAARPMTRVGLLYRIVRAEQRKGVADEIKTIVKKRLDAMSLRGAYVRVQGRNHVVVRLPRQDAAALKRLKRIIASTGSLEFRLVASYDSAPYEKWVASRRTRVAKGYTAYTLSSVIKDPEEHREEAILVCDRVEMTGEHIKSAWANPIGSGSQRPTITLAFTPVGEQKLGAVTGKNIDKRLAIIFGTRRRADGSIAEKGRCCCAPVIRSAIFGTAEISGNFDLREARELCAVLMAGSLPAPMRLEKETVVEP